MKGIFIIDSSDKSQIGKWIVWCDFDMHGRDLYPTGLVTTTFDAKEAKEFENFPDAFEYWRTQSKAVPIRPDGKPNRPLTALSVEIKDIPQ